VTAGPRPFLPQGFLESVERSSRVEDPAAMADQIARIEGVVRLAPDSDQTGPGIFRLVSRKGYMALIPADDLWQIPEADHGMFRISQRAFLNIPKNVAVFGVQLTSEESAPLSDRATTSRAMRSASGFGLGPAVLSVDDSEPSIRELGQGVDSLSERQPSLSIEEALLAAADGDGTNGENQMSAVEVDNNGRPVRLDMSRVEIQPDGSIAAVAEEAIQEEPITSRVAAGSFAPAITGRLFLGGTAMNLGIVAASHGATYLYTRYVNPHASIAARVIVGASPIFGFVGFQVLTGTPFVVAAGHVLPGLASFYAMNTGISFGLDLLGLRTGEFANTATSLGLSSALATLSTYATVPWSGEIVSAAGLGFSTRGALLSVGSGVGVGLGFAGGVILGMAADYFTGQTISRGYHFFTGRNLVDGTLSGMFAEAAYQLVY